MSKTYVQSPLRKLQWICNTVAGMETQLRSISRCLHADIEKKNLYDLPPEVATELLLRYADMEIQLNAFRSYASQLKFKYARSHDATKRRKIISGEVAATPSSFASTDWNRYLQNYYSRNEAAK